MTTADRVPDALFAEGPPFRLQRFLHLAGPVAPDVIRRALLTALLAWVPVLALATVGAVFSWNAGLRSFASDIGFHTRSLVATPLLIVSETFVAIRLGGIAQHFLDAGLVREPERPRFEAAIASTRRLRDAPLEELIVALLAYATTFALARAAHEGPAWRLAAGGPLPIFSAAGWWLALVSTPILLALVFGWLWRVVLWTRFLWLVARIRLRLVPAHPDLTAGLRFVSYSVRAFVPVALGFGCIVAGTMANGVLMRGQSLAGYRYSALGLVVFVLVLFAAPLLVFIRTLHETWRRGVFQYGAIADALGREFEHVWFETRTIDESALGVQDFSATVDLYQFVANVYEMRLVPFDLRSLVMLVIATLFPFVPVLFVALPFDVILSKLVALWL